MMRSIVTFSPWKHLEPPKMNGIFYITASAKTKLITPMFEMINLLVKAVLAIYSIKKQFDHLLLCVSL